MTWVSDYSTNAYVLTLYMLKRLSETTFVKQESIQILDHFINASENKVK